jgi:ubiquinone/menaquinone biosynthesis C-methylase UbiE
VKNPTQRFSDRVENYVRYRPGYPTDVIKVLRDECGLTTDSVIADVASGTGILTRMLLDHGNRVFAVEPNREMREAAERLLAGYPKLVSVEGTAEATTLAKHSVDLVTAAQAAHWFDLAKARQEFARILKPGGWCALIWNERSTDTTPFLRDYEQLLLTYGTDYQDVRHENTTLGIAHFFAPAPSFARVFDYQQVFDYEGLQGRLLSSSYVPGPEHTKHAPMLEELRRLFQKYQQQGKVSVDYKTRVYCGTL